VEAIPTHYEAALIVQAVSWYPRYPLSYRNILSRKGIGFAGASTVR
jgi:transposase-like protein